MSSSKRIIVLMTSDGQSFEVEESVAMQSVTIKNMLEDVVSDDGTIPLPNVTSDVLAKVIEYCNRHASNNSSPDKQEEGAPAAADKSTADADLKAFDTVFVNVDQSTLFDLIMAANYLNIKSLLDLTCQTVADMCKGKNPEEIRKHFNIENDFSPEEEEEIIKKNGWAWGQY